MSQEFDLNQEEELLTLFDEEGNETLYRKLLEFEHSGFNKHYVILAEESNFNSDDDDEQIDLIPMIVEELEGEENMKFSPVTSDEEWDMIEEIVNTNFDEVEE